MRLEQGKRPRVLNWGEYTEEVEEVEAMVKRAGEDLAFLKRDALEALMSQKELEQLKKIYVLVDKITQASEFDMERARREMGNWVASYWEAAGYEEWMVHPLMYKAMIVNAFPPLKDLATPPVLDHADMSLEEVEESVLKFLKVADAHLAARRTFKPFLSRFGLYRALRKRK